MAPVFAPDGTAATLGEGTTRVTLSGVLLENRSAGPITDARRKRLSIAQELMRESVLD